MAQQHGTEARVQALMGALQRVAERMRRREERLAQRVGQSQARWHVLSAASGPGRTVPQVARRLGGTRQGVQRTADRLVADGLAQYAPNPDHRRSPLLVLTRVGEQTLALLTEGVRREHVALTAAVDGADLDAAERVLARLEAALEEEGGPTGD